MTHRHRIIPAALAMFALAVPLAAQTAGYADSGTSEARFLPNQWTLRPAGVSLPLGDFPVSVAVSPDGRHGAILHCGYGDHEVRVVDLKERRQTAAVTVDNAWLGAAFAPDGKRLYVSGGADDCALRFDFDAGSLAAPTTVTLFKDEKKTTGAKPRYSSGLAITPDGGTAYVAAQLAACLVKADLRSSPTRHEIQARFDTPSANPYAVVLHPNGRVAYVSLWGGSAVAEVRLRDGQMRVLSTDPHPNHMVLSKDGSRLFVACANTNLVDVIDTGELRVTERLNTAMFPNMPAGSTPNGLALSADGNTLLVANADNNTVAVFDVSRPGASASRGFIPTGWYPTAAGFAPDGAIFVVNGKGEGTLANPEGPDPTSAKFAKQYIGGLLRGSVSFIEKPDDGQMRRHSAEALKTTPLRPDLAPVIAPEPGNPVPAKVGDPSPIKHCVYIIKENRTYDQVLGDMPEGNGDPKLCLFGEKVTPNHHAIAREWVLLDNFYVESEVSADGHEWTTGAYATDFVEKTWPPLYGGHGKLGYPAEGSNPAADPVAGHIWDRAKEAGVTYRSYGEWVSGGGKGCKGRTKDPALKGHFDPCYPSYNPDVSDLDRADRFLKELAGFEKTGELPRLILMRLPNDHTAGTAKGKPTPRAYVAQNDLALGTVLEALSKSRFWKEMAVFVIEDDAQNGPDHVDAHRTIAFVAGPHVKRGFVDHRMYSTASMLRTMELILGLKPMSQFDAAARPMYSCFTDKPDFRPYTKRDATWPLDEKNGPRAPMQKESASLDLTREDSNPDVLFNEIIWKSVHGEASEMPPPVRAAFVMPEQEGEEGEGD